MPSNDRLRQHPEDRLAEPIQLIDLPGVAAGLRSEPHGSVAGHRQIAIVRHGPVTVILFAFEAGGVLKEHSAEGVVTIQVLKGRLHLVVGGDSREAGPGQLVALAPGVMHSVRAPVASEMLLTVHRVAQGADPDPAATG